MRHSMDKIHRLVSLVMRAFYSPEHCIIVDILMNVNTINDDDLAKQLNAKVKEVQLVCGLLKAHGLIKVESKTEELGKQQGFVVVQGNESAAAKRKIQKSYYYLDYKQFIDVVKYKIHSMQAQINKDITTSSVKYEYECPTCEKKYTGLDVCHLEMNTEGFLCDLCHSQVQESQASSQSNSERFMRFMEQSKPIVDLLKQTDTLVLPEFKWDAAEGAVNNQKAITQKERKELAVSNEGGAVNASIVVSVVEDEQDQAKPVIELDPELESYYESLKTAPVIVMSDEDSEDEDEEFFTV